MPKRKIPLVSGAYYHVFNRGNDRGNIFFDAADYVRFLGKICQYHEEYPLEIFSFSLLPNHFHFLVQQTSLEFPISKFFGVLLNSHSRYINTKYERVGHAVQGRFKANPVLTDESFLQVSRYIHLNSIKELILEPRFIRRGDSRNLNSALRLKLHNYPWSSYRYIANKQEPVPSFLNLGGLLSVAGGLRNYRKFVEAKIFVDDIHNLDTLNV